MQSSQDHKIVLLPNGTCTCFMKWSTALQKIGASSVNRTYQVVFSHSFLCYKLAHLFCGGCFFEISMESLTALHICHFTCRYIYVPVGGSQSSLLGTLFSTALTFAFVSYWHGGQSYLWYWGALNWLGVIVENGTKRMLSISLIQDLIVSWIFLCFIFLFPGSMLIWSCWLLVWFNQD